MSFYVLNFFGACQFILIGKNWTKIMKEWSFMEMAMRSYGILNMKRRYVVITSVIMTLALGNVQIVSL